MAEFDKKEFRQKFQRVEELVHSIESSSDSTIRSNAIELMQTVMELHGAGIERMMEIAFESDSNGSQIIDEFASDEIVKSLLFLYGLHPLDIETRVTKALEKARPYLQSHGGNAEIIEVTDGIVRLRMIGSCSGCPSSGITLKETIEKAIYEAAPDIIAIETINSHEEPKMNGFVQIKGINQTATA